MRKCQQKLPGVDQQRMKSLMAHRRRYRLSTQVVVIGCILLTPSFLGMRAGCTLFIVAANLPNCRGCGTMMQNLLEMVGGKRLITMAEVAEPWTSSLQFLQNLFGR